MQKIETLAKWLQEKQISATFLTSTENILYFTGVHCHPHERLLALMIFPTADPLLIVPKLDEADVRATDWPYQLLAIDDTENTWEKIRKTIPCTIQSLAIETEHLTHQRLIALNQIFNNPSYHAAEEKIRNMRLVKSTTELQALREAARLADHAIEIGAEEIAEGRTEMEILAAIEYRLKKEGIQKMAFDTMVLTGANAASPHGIPGNSKIAKGDFILFDLGVIVDGYCSDISRTLALGNPTDEQNQIYNTVLHAQKAAIAASQPGKTCKQLDQTARKIIAEAGYGEYFPHRLGHGLGLSVHEFPSISSTSETRLTEGMVFTIEPGIYVPNIAGVRIEDDLHITTNGVEILTKYPKELQIL